MLRLTIRRADAPSYRTTVLELPEREDLLAEKLERIGVGVTLEKNCRVEKLEGDDGALQALVGASVNADELQYLAKRLDSFDRYETQTFRAVAAAEKLTEVQDFINLTFNLDCYVVITDFTELAQIGRRHLTALEHGIIPDCPATELEAAGRALIAGGGGTITPYGVLYRTGSQLELLYNGRQFPEYQYRDFEWSVTLSPDEDFQYAETIYMPCWDIEIKKALLRLGAADAASCFARWEPGRMSAVLKDMILDEHKLSEHLDELNGLARCYRGFDARAAENFHAIAAYTQPQSPAEALCLAENFYEFTVIPGVGTPEAYGRHMIEDSGHFDLDPDLAEYVDFRRYGERRVQQENGFFTHYGYIAYTGATALVEEILERSQALEQGQRMGGF